MLPHSYHASKPRPQRVLLICGNVVTYFQTYILREKKNKIFYNEYISLDSYSIGLI